MLFIRRNFVPGLLCTIKPYFKNLKTYIKISLKNLGFYSSPAINSLLILSSSFNVGMAMQTKFALCALCV